jgi:hypothetical protein
MTGCLPATCVLLVDELEDFLGRDPSEMASFKRDGFRLSRFPPDHWLFGGKATSS